jgi:XisH protein
MSALDQCESETIRAFQKAGWQVRQKPFFIQVTGTFLRADVCLERPSNGNSEQIIVVEIKCFKDFQRDLEELYKAIGQYQIYRVALRLRHFPFTLFLTIPHDAYERFYNRPEFMEALQDTGIKCVIINLEKEEIVRWIT